MRSVAGFQYMTHCTVGLLSHFFCVKVSVLNEDYNSFILNIISVHHYSLASLAFSTITVGLAPLLSDYRLGKINC